MAQTIIEFLAGAAERFGERPAVMFKPGIRYQKWSYAELWEDAGRVASLLRERALEKGDRARRWVVERIQQLTEPVRASADPLGVKRGELWGNAAFRLRLDHFRRQWGCWIGS